MRGAVGWGPELRPLDTPIEPGANRSGQIVADTYRLQERVGVGGMAEVYAAEHLRMGRRFAVKILRADRAPRAGQRFRREAEAIARIDNEYVVSLVDCGDFHDGTPYLVMELLHGEDLRKLLNNASPLPIPRAVSLIWDACQGVTAVHRAGLIHRDLKPENLFVTLRSTGEDWCKVLDFGVAKLEVSGSTAEGALVGTVRYMAPEQLLDGASAGPAVDVYALGAILYECLCGESPHAGTSIQELMFKIMNEQPVSLALRREAVPPRLAEAVMRALEKVPERRFRDVPAFARAIAPFMRATISAESAARTETIDLEQKDSQPRRSLGRKGAASFAFGSVFGAGVLVLAHSLASRAAGVAGVEASRASKLASATASRPGGDVVSVLLPAIDTAVRVHEDVMASAPEPSASSARALGAAPPPLLTAHKASAASVPAGAFLSHRFDPQNPYSR